MTDADAVSSEDAVREYVVRIVAQSIDNTQALYREVKAAALTAVQDEKSHGNGWDRDGFLMMLDGRGQVRREEVAQVVGDAVSDTIHDWIVGERNGRDLQNDRTDHLLFILGELLDLEDARQRILFGEHFMPRADEWEADDEDDEDDDL
jgi:hypothetical protein